MIVRDEENNIDRALRSVKDCVDEIVVVDTGSVDRTPEIVKKYTDKLYFHEWKNDFSEARNYSLKFPRCEWVMILDADEEASEEFCRNIRRYLENLPEDVNTVYVPTISYLDWDFKRKEFASTARIFRNGTVYYKNIVHNMPVYKPKVESVPWPIYHYGYIWTRKLRKKKYERTGTLIRKQLKMAKTPEERLYYLVQLYKTEATAGKPFVKSEVALQTFHELAKARRIPTIALEFMYYFASDLMNLGYLDEAEKLLEKAIKVDPDYPDSYFGMLALNEKRQNWEKIIEWGRKFFEVFGKIVEKLDSPKWTVNSMKVTGAASTVIARAYVHEGNVEKAFYWIKKAVEHSEENGENIEKFLNIFLSDIESLDCEMLKSFVDIAEFLMEYSKLKNVKLNFSRFFERVAECSLDVPKDLIESFDPEDAFSKALKERLLDEKDHLLDIIPGGENYREFVENYGTNGLVFLFDYLQEKKTSYEELLRILNEIRTIDDEKVKGLTLAFMGDVYLKSGKFKEALAVYKKALSILPEISGFLKPVIEDLKTVITNDMDGVFEEIYRYYSKGLEFVFDITKVVPSSSYGKFHLISESDHAFYASAVTTKDKEKIREFLNHVKNIDKFPFYYFRLAKTYEGEDWEKAYEYHKKACEENEKLADLRYGYSKYHGLYLSQKPGWRTENDEIIWSGNISEEFSTLSVISPVRTWRRSKIGFYYALPFHIDEAVEIYFKNLEKTKFRKLKINLEDLSNILMKSSPKSVRLSGKGFNEEKAKEFLKNLDIDVNESSDFLLLPFGLETLVASDFEKILKNFKGGIVVFANPTSEKSLVWRYPPFRIIRPYKYLSRILDSEKFRVRDLEKLNDDFYVLHFSK